MEIPRSKPPNSNLVIGVDVDEVCADLLSEWLRRYNLKYRDTLRPEDITDWNIGAQVKPECGDKIYAILDEPDLYQNIVPMRGALEAVELLRELGRVVFVTAGATNATEKFKWMKRWGFLPKQGHDTKDFICARDKALVRATFLFDDAVHNVDAFPGKAWLVSHHHNRNTKCLADRLPDGTGLKYAPEVLRDYLETNIPF